MKGQFLKQWDLLIIPNNCRQENQVQLRIIYAIEKPLRTVIFRRRQVKWHRDRLEWVVLGSVGMGGIERSDCS